MAESHDARRVPPASGDALSADALYKQGMAHYRRHQWRQAWQSFQGLKQADPGCREIDALLDELDIFIRLESLIPKGSPAGASEPTLPLSSPFSMPQMSGGAMPAPAPQAHPIWRPLAMAGVLMLAFLIVGAANPSLARRRAELRERGQAYQATEQWSEAINSFERLLLFAPDDSQVYNELSAAYKARGLQRAAEAETLEGQALYREAAQQWEMALADLGAARDVAIPAQSNPAPQIVLAQERRWSASLMDQAIGLGERQRWMEAIQVLQTLSAEQPGYRTADVQARLSLAYLQAGLASIASAETSIEVRKSISLLEQAGTAQPSNGQVSIALARARTYLQAMVSAEGAQWSEAIDALQGLLQLDPGYAAGQASNLLCRAHMQRAAARYQAGDLHLALADYEAIAASGCSQLARARQMATTLAVALSPTATVKALPMPIATPASP